MSVNGVEIKVGQKWRTRNGKLAEVIAGPDSGVAYMWCVEMLPSGPKWTANDRGEQLHDTPGAWDLLFLVEDPDLTLTQPAALMVEEIKTTPHPPRRAADWPEVAAAVDDTAGLLDGLKPGDGVYDPTPLEPHFEHSLPGALLGPDEALKDIRVTESDPRAQQTADSPKRRAVDDPVVTAIERLQANQDAQGRTPFTQAIERGDIVKRPARTGMSESVSISVSVDTSALHEELAQIQAAASALDRQIGGGHYKTFAIQPVEFIHKNGIGFIEGNCIKYLARWREKGGIQDLEKVKHYIDLLIELERGES